jgi:hypothetical protein
MVSGTRKGRGDQGQAEFHRFSRCAGVSGPTPGEDTAFLRYAQVKRSYIGKCRTVHPEQREGERCEGRLARGNTPLLPLRGSKRSYNRGTVLMGTVSMVRQFVA